MIIVIYPLSVIPPPSSVELVPRVSPFSGRFIIKAGTPPGDVHYTITRLRYKRWILALFLGPVAPWAREELRHKQASVLTLSSLRAMKNSLAFRAIASPRNLLLSNEILSGAINITGVRALRPRRKKGFYDPKSRSLPAPSSPSSVFLSALLPFPSLPSSKCSSKARASP